MTNMMKDTTANVSDNDNADDGDGDGDDEYLHSTASMLVTASIGIGELAPSSFHLHQISISTMWIHDPCQCIAMVTIILRTIILIVTIKVIIILIIIRS